MSSSVLATRNLQKTYIDNVGNQLHVLNKLNFEVAAGESIAIIGASGSGKSTLMHCLGGLDTINGGEVLVNGQSLHALAESEMERLRNQALGFVYQFHYLLSEFNAVENVAMPLMIRRMARKDAEEQAKHTLALVGLDQRMHHYPAQLSGGERQRVAIARAIVGKPQCILADEPTGNLDQQNTQRVWEVLFGLSKQYQTSVVIVTHDLELASRCDRRYVMKNGLLEVGGDAH